MIFRQGWINFLGITFVWGNKAPPYKTYVLRFGISIIIKHSLFTTADSWPKHKDLRRFWRKKEFYHLNNKNTTKITLQVRYLEGPYSSSWIQAFLCKHVSSKRFRTSSPSWIVITLHLRDRFSYGGLAGQKRWEQCFSGKLEATNWSEGAFSPSIKVKKKGKRPKIPRKERINSMDKYLVSLFFVYWQIS